MAAPLEQPRLVSLLEDAAHLLRRAPLDTLLCHWIGSVPFVLMLLVFWSHLTHPPVADLTCAAESFGMALLLIWMNCWRAVFAGRLHGQLSGAADRPWNPHRVWRLLANQAFVAATKPVVLPVSLAALFPFAGTVTFYRNVSVLAGREDLDPFAVIAKARHLARSDKLQSWLLQILLLLLSLILLLNVAITFIFLPQLVRMLTGYESAFTRSGESFFESRLFLLFVLGVTWLLFDPFVQAAYCLRCFHAESVETGEDLRAGLRRIRPAVTKGVAAAVIVLSQHDRARDAALNMMRFFSHESCGQCTPCRVGTDKAAQLMQAPVWDRATLDDLGTVMMDASICGLGQAAPNPIRSVQKHFAHEIGGAPS